MGTLFRMFYIVSLVAVIIGLRPQVCSSGISVSQFPSREEVLQLPEYCQVQQFMTKYLYMGTAERPGPEVAERRKAWAEILGPNNYEHLHHYCWGLANLNRCFEPVEPYPEYRMHRSSNLRMAIENFEYVKRRVSEDFPLMSELLMNEAVAYRELGKPDRAVDLLLGAIKYKKDYVQAYLELAQILERQKRWREAWEVLKKGLQATNNAPELRAALQSLSSSTR